MVTLQIYFKTLRCYRLLERADWFEIEAIEFNKNWAQSGSIIICQYDLLHGYSRLGLYLVSDASYKFICFCIYGMLEFYIALYVLWWFIN